MIVLETPDGWRCVTQSDHARLSHDLLSLWRADGLPEHPRREELLRAVREHDNGWREADSAPRLDVERQAPQDFTAVSPAIRAEIWRRGIERHRANDPYVAALVSEHARYLHAGARATVGEWADFLSGLPAERDAAAGDAGLDPEDLVADYRWLHLVDLLSLAVCAGWEQPFERWGFRGQANGGTLHLEPFPLAGATRFTVPCRLLLPSEHASDSDLATALATCRWQQFTVRISPGGAL